MLDVGEWRLSESGEREKSKWEAIVKKLIAFKVVENTKPFIYNLTSKGIAFAEKICAKFDCSINPHTYLTGDGVNGEHIVKIKEKSEKALLKKEDQVSRQTKPTRSYEPWLRFKCNNIILKDEKIANPDFGNGLIKTEPFGFYDEGILVFTSIGSKEIHVRRKDMYGNETTIAIDAYVVAKVAYRTISDVDPDGSVNNPFPTFYCSFFHGNPYSGIRYVDKEIGLYYEEDEVIDGREEIKDSYDGL